VPTENHSKIFKIQCRLFPENPHPLTILGASRLKTNGEQVLDPEDAC
jgi:hypothetical protein